MELKICSSLQNSRCTALAAKTIKVGHGHSISHPVHLGFEVFKELLEKKSGGDLKVEIFPNSQLGSEAEMAEMCKLGTMQGVMFGRFESMGMELYTPALPFMFKDYEQVNRVLSGPIGDYLASFTEDNGLKLLGSLSSFMAITASKKMKGYCNKKNTKDPAYCLCIL